MISEKEKPPIEVIDDKIMTWINYKLLQNAWLNIIYIVFGIAICVKLFEFSKYMLGIDSNLNNKWFATSILFFSKAS